jgi:hypothetical protein
MLRIRDVYPGSEVFSSRIPDQEDSRIRIRIKEFKYFNTKKMFLRSRKYDPGCSSRIRIPDFDFYPSQIPDTDPQHCLWVFINTTVMLKQIIFLRKTDKYSFCMDN